MLEDGRAEPGGRGEEQRTGAGWAGPYVVLVGEEPAVARLECRPEATGGEGGDGMATRVAGEAADWKGGTGGCCRQPGKRCGSRPVWVLRMEQE